MATLELYLIRHGIAEDRGEDYPDDSKRPLTSAGIKRLQHEVRALNALGITFDHSISCPLVRT
jgi:phosphohistidine phosphatase